MIQPPEAVPDVVKRWNDAGLTEDSPLIEALHMRQAFYSAIGHLRKKGTVEALAEVALLEIAIEPVRKLYKIIKQKDWIGRSQLVLIASPLWVPPWLTFVSRGHTSGSAFTTKWLQCDPIWSTKTINILVRNRSIFGFFLDFQCW